MSKAALLLAQLLHSLQPAPGRNGAASRPARGLLAQVVGVMGARGGGLCAWDGGGALLLSASRGLSAEAAGRFRRLAQTLPRAQSQPLAELGCQILEEGRSLGAGWAELERLRQHLGPQAALSLWPLGWGQGQGLCLLAWERRPVWEKGLAEAAAGALGLALGHVLLRRQAAAGAEDYRRVFMNSPDMICLAAQDGRWVDVNPAGVRLLGYESKEQLLAAKDPSLGFFMDPAARKPLLDAMEKDGLVRDYEVELRRKDGKPLTVAITAQVRRDQGRMLGYEGIIKDITQQKRAQEAAERQSLLLAGILEVMPVAVFVVDRQHRVMHWNRACQELTGVPASSMLGTTRVWQVFDRPEGVSLADLIVDGDWERLRQVYAEEFLRPSLLGHEAWEAQGHFPHLGGRSKDLFFTAAPLRDPQGQVLGAVEVILDVSDVRQLQSRLAESEALYRSLVEANREGMALHDGNGFVFANRPFLRMFGLTDLAQARGDLLELLAPGCQRGYLAWLKEVQEKSGGHDLFEGQGQRGEEVFELEVTAAPTVYKGGAALLFNVRDVSERRGMEEQLIRSERLAATGKLAFDIAHEVNNPLGGILTYAHLLAEDTGPGWEHASTLDRIIKLTHRCKIIVRGLLDFARQDRPEKELMDLNQVLSETFALIEGHVILHGVEVVRQLAPGLPRYYGHRTKLEQVFLNMIVNAAEAMDGGGRLEVRSWLEEGALRIQFKDDGPGLEPDVAARLFEPFFTTKSRGRGTGLGLAISFGIIKQHGGRILVVSRPGAGASFTVVLPLQT